MICSIRKATTGMFAPRCLQGRDYAQLRHSSRLLRDWTDVDWSLFVGKRNTDHMDTG